MLSPGRDNSLELVLCSLCSRRKRLRLLFRVGCWTVICVRFESRARIVHRSCSCGPCVFKSHRHCTKSDTIGSTLNPPVLSLSAPIWPSRLGSKTHSGVIVIIRFIRQLPIPLDSEDEKIRRVLGNLGRSNLFMLANVLVNASYFPGHDQQF